MTAASPLSWQSWSQRSSGTLLPWLFNQPASLLKPSYGWLRSYLHSSVILWSRLRHSMAAETRTWFSTRDETWFPLKTLPYSQDVKLRRSRKLFFKLQPHLLTGVLHVCLMNIGSCAQWDAKINCAQLPPLIKPTRDKPITEGCRHYLDSCAHGANMDSSGTELAKLRAPLVHRVSPNLG